MVPSLPRSQKPGVRVGMGVGVRVGLGLGGWGWGWSSVSGWLRYGRVGMGCHGARYVQHAQGWYAHHVQCVGPWGELPCAAGTYSTRRRRLRIARTWCACGLCGTYVLPRGRTVRAYVSTT